MEKKVELADMIMRLNLKNKSIQQSVVSFQQGVEKCQSHRMSENFFVLYKTLVVPPKSCLKMWTLIHLSLP